MKTLFTLFVLFFATSYCYPQSGWVLQNSGTDYDIIGISCPDNQNCWAIGISNPMDSLYGLSDSIIVLHTSNGGVLWENKIYKNIKLLYETGFPSNCLDFYDKNNGFIVGVPFSFYTTNGGIKWEQIDTVSDNHLRYITYSNNHTIWAINSSLEEIHFSTDNGMTWFKNLSIWGNFSGIYFLDSLNGWAIGDSIYKTTDGGKNWIGKPNSDSFFEIYYIIFTDKNNGWICENSSLFNTTDGGNSWNNNFDASLRLFKIIFTDKNNGWLLGAPFYTHFIPSLFKTTNGGRDWLIDNNFPKDSIYTIAFSDSLNGWAVGLHGHIWHTTTGGVTFVNDNRVNAIDPYITISPNPAQDLVSAKCNYPIQINTKIELFSSEGLLIRDLKAADFIGKQQFQFSVRDLPTGIYFLKMSYSGGVHAYPVCIMK